MQAVRLETVDVPVEFAGHQVTLEGFAGDHITEVMTQTGQFYETDLLAHIADRQPTGTIIDVGAFIGTHSVFFARFTDANRVLAVEPNPQAQVALEHNIARNYLHSAVTISRVALGKDYGHVGLRTPNPNNLGHTRTVKGDQVAQFPLDGLVIGNEVDVLKIDAEGDELAILRGASQLLASQRPEIYAEARSPWSKLRLDNFLYNRGYMYIRSFTDGASSHVYRPR